MIGSKGREGGDGGRGVQFPYKKNPACTNYCPPKNNMHNLTHVTTLAVSCDDSRKV